MNEPTLRVIPAFDNHPLYTRVWLPDEEPVGVLVLAHGLAEHGGVYGELAASVVGQGFVMYAADHRGHGWTAPDMTQLGFFAAEDGWAKAVGDLGTVIASAEKAHPGVPLFLLGHSMGSIMARCYAIENSQQLAGPGADGGRLAGARLGPGCWPMPWPGSCQGCAGPPIAANCSGACPSGATTPLSGRTAPRRTG